MGYDSRTGAETVVEVSRVVSLGADKTSTFPNSAAANSQQTQDWAAQGTPRPRHLIAVHNPSTVTAVTVIFQNILSAFAGQTRYAEVARVSVPVNTTKTFLVDGWNVGSGGGRITLQNDTALGGADTFVVTVRAEGI